MARTKTNDQAFGGLLERMDAALPPQSAETASAPAAEAASRKQADPNRKPPLDATEKCTFRIRKDLVALMKRASYEQDLTKSYIVNAALEEWLAGRGYRV